MFEMTYMNQKTGLKGTMGVFQTDMIAAEREAIA